MKFVHSVSILILLSAIVAAQKYRQVDLNETPVPSEVTATDFECGGDVEFELITGYVYSSADDIIDSKHRTLRVADCIRHCREKKTCRAVNFETGLCILFQTSAGENSGKTTKQLKIMQNNLFFI